jgi:hypothetical protein
MTRDGGSGRAGADSRTRESQGAVLRSTHRTGESVQVRADRRLRVVEATERRRRDGLADLQAWYLGSLRPKLAQAASRGAIEPAAAADLERQLGAMLDLATGERQAAA